MKKHFLLMLTVLSAVTLSFGTAFAAETELSKQMSGINKGLRTLKRQVADPSKKTENLEILGKIKHAIDESCKLEPSKTKDQGDKAAYTNKYKEEMVDLGKAVGELEMAIKVDKADDAKKALDKIYQLKDKGHKDFGVGED